MMADDRTEGRTGRSGMQNIRLIITAAARERTKPTVIAPLPLDFTPNFAPFTNEVEVNFQHDINFDG